MVETGWRVGWCAGWTSRVSNSLASGSPVRAADAMLLAICARLDVDCPARARAGAFVAKLARTEVVDCSMRVVCPPRRGPFGVAASGLGWSAAAAVTWRRPELVALVARSQ